MLMYRRIETRCRQALAGLSVCQQVHGVYLLRESSESG